jgi:hypothetical protein
VQLYISLKKYFVFFRLISTLGFLIKKAMALNHFSRFIKSRLFLFFLIILVLSLPWPFKEDAPSLNLNGPAFTTDPSKIIEMPDEWVNQPVRHDPSIGKFDLVVTLDQHLFTPLRPFINKYARMNRLRIFVNEGTCGISAGMLARKEVDIGGFCCAPGETDRLPGLRFHTIGIDAIALLVHPENPIDNLTLEQARRIFMGEIRRWSEFESTTGEKGPDIPVQPIGRLHCKLRPGHWRLLLDNEDLFSPSLLEVGAIPDMISQVASNPSAIGYEVVWNTARYREQGKVKILRINGISPLDQDALIRGRYPLYRVYNLTTWHGEGLTNPKAEKLIQYLLKAIKGLPEEHNIIPASRLKEAGWRFKGDELVGEPD